MSLFRQLCPGQAELSVVWRSSGNSGGRNEPPKEEEVAAAECAPKGQEKPVESRFKGISGAYGSEID